MQDNDAVMPGTQMRQFGIEDRTIQDLTLSYLHSLSTRAPKAIA